MKLVSSAKRLYRDKTSEIDEKYYISKDRVYLYFDKGYDCSMLVNDELFKGSIYDIHAAIKQLSEALAEKRSQLSERNQQIDYKCYIYTNSMIRSSMLLQLTKNNAEFIFAKAGKHTQGQLFKAVCKDQPFILLNVNALACNKVSEIKSEGVYKIKDTIELNCSISGQDIHHLGQTIGRNIEKMEGQLVRSERKKDPSFYLPRLFSFKAMRRTQWEGQIVRNYNLLQCANMSGLLQFDPDESFKILRNVISFDIKSAYLSVMINRPVFPKDLTVIDIDTKSDRVDFCGNHLAQNPYHVAFDIVDRLDRFEDQDKWYYLAIDPCFEGDDPTVEFYLRMLKPFRRNFKQHPDTVLKYVHQDQVIGFLKWDRAFYDEYYSIYTELDFTELIYNLLLLCPDAKIVLMYSKQPSDYLPKPFRDSKMELYLEKEKHAQGSVERDVSKLYTELTYGKGLQLRNFQTDDEARKAITNETINISQSLTCCSFTRYRLVHDWKDFHPVYMDSDSVKFEFSPETNNLLQLTQRLDELAEENRKVNVAAGYPESNLGSWNVDGVYNYMMFLRKKVYIGYNSDGTIELATSGCDAEAAREYFKEGTLDLLQKIEREQKLTIPNGKRRLVILPNNEYQYFQYDDVTYEK
jgi:hypothetical protein